MMELLNIKKQNPDEYVGKSIYIFENEYLIGSLAGEGGYKLVYRLINKKSGICNFVIKIPLDQHIAAGIIDYPKDVSLWNNKNIYEYSRDLAKTAYNFDGYKDHTLPIFADFLDIPEFSTLDNKYNGIFIINEFFNGPGDEETGGIYVGDSTEEFLLLLKIALRAQSRTENKCREVVDLSREYLEKFNPFNDTIMENYINASICLTNYKKQVDESYLLEITNRMIEVEPFLKSHLYLAMEVFNWFKLYKKIIDLFESFKNIIYEPFSNQRVMLIIENAFLQLGRTDEAKKYLKYLHPRYAKSIENRIRTE